LTLAESASDCDIGLLGAGRHGTVYRIASRTQEAIYAGFSELAVKLFGPGAPVGPGLQFELQARMHFAIGEKMIDGWTVAAPRPLEAVGSPAALMMTVAEGTRLDRYLARHWSADELSSAAQALAAAMAPYWASGHVHGDFSFRNILIDPARRRIWVIDTDPSVDVPGEWSAAAIDLAGMIYDLATDIRHFDRRRRMFAETLFIAHAMMIPSGPERRNLLKQTRACAFAELDLLSFDLSPRGLYHRLQRRIARRRIVGLLAELHVNVMAGAVAAETLPSNMPALAGEK
jgi:hypothetical protein